jgi:hypothetical protein
MFTLDGQILITTRCSSTYYFNSFGIFPLVPSIQAFIQQNCTTWSYNKRQLQGLTSDVCGQYYSLFTLNIEGGYTPQQFITLFTGRGNADRQVKQIFASEFGATLPRIGLYGRQNETVVKELCVSICTAIETFRFKSPYKVADNVLSENDINWADGHIEYKFCTL